MSSWAVLASRTSFHFVEVAGPLDRYQISRKRKETHSIWVVSIADLTSCTPILVLI
jgi:hypothetical protein